MLLTDKKDCNKNCDKKKSTQYSKDKLLTPNLLLPETLLVYGQFLMSGKTSCLFVTEWEKLLSAQKPGQMVYLIVFFAYLSFVYS